LQTPLITLTPGEMGSTAQETERKLAHFFRLARSWNAILLLDNADIFLEARALTDAQRNAVVSVFLRALETFQGTLFLTSNRIGTFDEAFKSRIRLALHLDTLTEDARYKIWNNILSTLETSGENVIDMRINLPKLAKLELNGREINNVFRNAKEFASFQKQPLFWEHFMMAADNISRFSDYLKQVHSNSYEEGGGKQKE